MSRHRGNCFAGVLIVAFALLLGCLGSGFCQTADEYFELGKTDLEKESLTAAHAHFQSALSLNPNHEGASFFYALTSMLMISNSSAFNSLLDRVGVSAAGRNIFRWEADFERDAYGNILLPADAPRGADLQSFAKNNILPVINEAINSLGKPSPGFQTYFNWTFETGEGSRSGLNTFRAYDSYWETNDWAGYKLVVAGSEYDIISNTYDVLTVSPNLSIPAGTYEYRIVAPIEIDYGDVLAIRGALRLAKAAILIFSAYNFNVDIDYLVSLLETVRPDIETHLISAYPQLLTLLPDHQLPEAKANVREAIALLNAAVDFIVHESDPQGNDLLVVDADDGAEFSRISEECDNALAGPVFIEEMNTQVDLTRFFDYPKNLRNYLPVFNGSLILRGSFPDPTFGGIFPAMTATELHRLLDENGILVSGDATEITVTTSPAGLSFTADGATFTGPQSFTWVVGSSHTIAAATPQGTGGTRYKFTNWNDGGASSHAITVPSSPAAYTASFTTQYRLTTAASPTSGGAIIANPTSADGFYNSGTSVQLTAAAETGYVFSHWSGNLTGTANPATVTLSTSRSVTANFVSSHGGGFSLTLNPGGAAGYKTPGSDADAQAGYAVLAMDSGVMPYGTAVFSFKQEGVTVTEAGIPASPATTSARIFIDYRSDVNAVPGRSEAGTIDINTGIAVVNYGSATANVVYTLRDVAGATVTTGNGTINAGRYFACFIDQLKGQAGAPGFNLPSDFQTAIQFGSLEITSDRPVSVLALRGTSNQRDEFLITTTPVADLTQSPGIGPIYFPQFVDGGGYTTSLILLNTSAATETGSFQIRDKNGAPLVVNPVGGTTASSFRYSIQPGGVFRFQTDGFPESAKAGWVRLTPDAGTSTPVGSGVFGFNPADKLVSESGIPAAAATTHARIYVDLSNRHNTGLALANLANADAQIAINAYAMDGTTRVGSGQPIPLGPNGYTAAFADQFITGLTAGFTGVLDITSETPFAALSLRSLTNEREDFLMTTFPVADANVTAPSPIVFPQVADGGGYITEFILISPTGGATTTLRFYSWDSTPWDIEN